MALPKPLARIGGWRVTAAAAALVYVKQNSHRRKRGELFHSLQSGIDAGLKGGGDIYQSRLLDCSQTLVCSMPFC